VCIEDKVLERVSSRRRVDWSDKARACLDGLVPDQCRESSDRRGCLFALIDGHQKNPDLQFCWFWGEKLPTLEGSLVKQQDNPVCTVGISVSACIAGPYSKGARSAVPDGSCRALWQHLRSKAGVADNVSRFECGSTK
jgi:hypothetical protein